jgi:hypothetical protein
LSRRTIMVRGTVALNNYNLTTQSLRRNVPTNDGDYDPTLRYFRFLLERITLLWKRKNWLNCYRGMSQLANRCHNWKRTSRFSNSSKSRFFLNCKCERRRNAKWKKGVRGRALRHTGNTARHRTCPDPLAGVSTKLYFRIALCYRCCTARPNIIGDSDVCADNSLGSLKLRSLPRVRKRSGSGSPCKRTFSKNINRCQTGPSPKTNS